MCQINYVSFSLHVTGDIVGKILAWFSLLPIFIVVGFITLIVFRREIHTVRKFTSVANHIVLRAKLQNTGPLMYILLHNNSAYCVILRS